MFEELERNNQLSKNIMHTLEDSDMILRKASSHTRGFDFLLDNIKSQVQIFLYSYIKHLFSIRNSYRGKSQDDISEGQILNLILNLTLLVPSVNYNIRPEGLPGVRLPESLV